MKKWSKLTAVLATVSMLAFGTFMSCSSGSDDEDDSPSLSVSGAISATVDGTISQDFTVILKNDSFKSAAAAGYDLSSVVTLSKSDFYVAGTLSITAKEAFAVSAKTATVTVSGTAVASAVSGTFTVTIAAAALTGGKALTSGNVNYAITTESGGGGTGLTLPANLLVDTTDFSGSYAAAAPATNATVNLKTSQTETTIGNFVYLDSNETTKVRFRENSGAGAVGDSINYNGSSVTAGANTGLAVDGTSAAYTYYIGCTLANVTAGTSVKVKFTYRVLGSTASAKVGATDANVCLVDETGKILAKETYNTTWAALESVDSHAYTDSQTVTVTAASAGRVILVWDRGTNGATGGTDLYSITIEDAATALADQDAPAASNFTATAVTTVGGSDGQIAISSDISDVTTLEYKLSTATDYTAVTATPITGLSGGVYNIRLAAVANSKNASPVTDVSVFAPTVNAETSNENSILGLEATSVSSSADTVATAALGTVGNDGKIVITSVGAGTATVTCTSYTGNTATIPVTVSAVGVITIGTIGKNIYLNDDSITIAIDGPTTGVVEIDETFTATISGTHTDAPVTYKWDLSNDNESNWVDLLATTDSVTHSIPEGDEGTYIIRVTATGKSGSYITAKHTVVISATASNITASNTVTISGTVAVANGSTTELTATVDSPYSAGSYEAVTYQWSSSTDNVTFTDITDATAAAYTVPAANSTTVYYKATVTGATSGVSISKVATVVFAAATHTLNMGASVTALTAETVLNDIFYGETKVKTETPMYTTNATGSDCTVGTYQFSLTSGKASTSTNAIKVTTSGSASIVVYVAQKTGKTALFTVLDSAGKAATCTDLKVNGTTATVFPTASTSSIEKYEFTLSTAGTYYFGGTAGGIYIYGMTIAF